MATVYRIEWLADHPGIVPTLVQWFEREWAPYYGPEGPGNALAELRDSSRCSKLPVALVAFCDGNICGTAALKTASVSTHHHLTPWLAALIVDPAFRRRGVGRRLIAAVEGLARRFDYDIIHAATGTKRKAPASLLRARGWVLTETVPHFVFPLSIFRKGLHRR